MVKQIVQNSTKTPGIVSNLVGVVKISVLISIAGVLFLVGCTTAPRFTRPTKSRTRTTPGIRKPFPSDTGKVHIPHPDLPAETLTIKTSYVGKASFYGTKFHGRTTANGEQFSMHKMTAAHKTLPFGTLVRVTNLSNGLSVIVRINDRGPYKKRRVIDLSFAAAKKIDMVANGIANVRIDVLR